MTGDSRDSTRTACLGKVSREFSSLLKLERVITLELEEI